MSARAPKPHTLTGKLEILGCRPTFEFRIGGYLIADTFENREEIERRMNMHDTLVEALRLAQRALECGFPMPSQEAAQTAYRVARVAVGHAIEKAGGR